MIWDIKQTKRFSRLYKKLHDNIVVDVDSAIEKIQHNPEIGDRKVGDLAALRVLKFRSNGQLYLLGYTLDETICLIYLESVGSHENFYRDLKRDN